VLSTVETGNAYKGKLIMQFIPRMGCVIGPNDPRAIDLQRGLADGSIIEVTDKGLEEFAQDLADIVGKLPVSIEDIRTDSTAYAEIQGMLAKYRKQEEK
jgi:hypothetical protein